MMPPTGECTLQVPITRLRDNVPLEAKTFFSSAELAAHPAFAVVLGHLARGMLAIYAENPRLARTQASHQRWLLSQAAAALYLEYKPDDPASGLTAGRLKDFILPKGSASRNTILKFLEEMLHYRFARYADGDGKKRRRRLEMTDISYEGLLRWFAANLAALDQLDGGCRAEKLQARPQLLRLAQPWCARACIEHPGWREPPARLALFQWTEAGGLVMDELIARIDLSREADGKLSIGRVQARVMAEHFMMSRTHLQRLFNKAADHGCLGWYGADKSGDMWFSRDFLAEYCGWQAIKFSIVDEAFSWALEMAAETESGADAGI